MATTIKRRVAFRTPLIIKLSSGGTIKSKLKTEITYPVAIELDREDVGYMFLPMAGYFKSTPLIITVGKVRYDYLGNGILYVPVYLVTPDIKLKAKIGIFEFRLSYENVKWIDETDIERFTFNEFTVEDYMNFINNTLLFDGVNSRYLQQFKANDDSYTKVGIGIPVDELIAVVKEASAPPKIEDAEAVPETETETETEPETEKKPEKESELEKTEPEPVPAPVLPTEPETEKKPEKESELEKTEPAPAPTPAPAPETETEKKTEKESETEKPETETESAPEKTEIPRFPDDMTRLDYSKFNIVIEEFNIKKEKSEYEAIISSVKPAPINDALESMEFEVVENGGKGDCFFESVQQAFESIGKTEITVANQREFLSDKADEDVFEQYKILDQTSDLDEYKFKAPVPITLEDFKTYMKTQNFWADEYAITQLEQQLNVRFVILLQDKYANPDLPAHNIISCGFTTEPKKDINPAYYIILTLGGAHYRLVTYKSRAVHTATELPYIIKKHIIASCMVGRDKITNVLQGRDNTLYSQIPIFREMRNYMVVNSVGKSEIERMMPPVSIGPVVGGQRRTSYRATLKHPRLRLSLSGTRKNRHTDSYAFSNLPQIRRSAR